MLAYKSSVGFKKIVTTRQYRFRPNSWTLFGVVKGFMGFDKQVLTLIERKIALIIYFRKQIPELLQAQILKYSNIRIPWFTIQYKNNLLSGINDINFINLVKTRQ